MDVRTVATTPFSDQKPGTSGLRKKVKVFQQPSYLENYIQALFDTVSPGAGAMLVLGGDGRYHNREAIQMILKMAAANGYGRVVVGRQASSLLPPRRISSDCARRAAESSCRPATIPAARKAISASNTTSPTAGRPRRTSPTPSSAGVASFARSTASPTFPTSTSTDPARRGRGDGGRGCGPRRRLRRPYGALFDFDGIRAWLKQGNRIRFDAMSAVTGPYAKEILEQRLGAPDGTVINAAPLPDFGGIIPTRTSCTPMSSSRKCTRADAPALGAASDGDGDRNMIMGRRFFVTPSDSIALIAANAHLVRGYRGGLKGVARSLPTSRAADRVAKALAIPFFENSDGLEVLRQPARRGADHALRRGELRHRIGPYPREGRALGGALLAEHPCRARRERGGGSCASIGRSTAAIFTRAMTTRRSTPTLAEDLIGALKARLPSLPARRCKGCGSRAPRTSPIPIRSTARSAGTRASRSCSAERCRIVYRLSGTGTAGATLRVYVERFERDTARHDEDPQKALAREIAAAYELAEIEARLGRKATAIT